MSSKKRSLQKKFPCRDNVIHTLYELLGDPEETFPPSIYFYGHSGTGKTSILTKFLKRTHSKTIILDCIECYTSRILYENILNKFHSHHLRKEDNFAPYMKCETLKDFITDLQQIGVDSDNNDEEEETSSYIICLDNAERVRDMDANILPAFMRLPELTGLNICCILVSQLPFEKYYTKMGLPEQMSIYLPQYNKNEVQKILTDDFERVRDRLLSRLRKNPPMQLAVDIERAEETISGLTSDFYGNFLNVFLSVFYKACRDLPELKVVSTDCFDIYVEPVLNGTIDKNDVSRLWRHITNPLKIALAQVYMRMDQDTEVRVEGTFEANQSVKKLAQSLELPYYGKYLLIAAFLASHNSAKEDKRLFVKHHGKQRKRLQTVNARAKVSEKMSTSLGPKSFSIDRLLAIFYAILDEKVGLTCNLLAQISTLVHLKLLSYVSGENNVVEGSAKLQCTVGLEFILYIGKVVGFNVRQYLCDFM
ncbi:origin recognition complex subunit 5 [Episyrphus balteatus]|uniref:origin recognition complex subunit 5 n=1 Tax=Episyrphus balteatus TaxID=286459 RepID=UPI0024858485|nr:origin recognition complex subunit 5 [Episyrphus balteatus]